MISEVYNVDCMEYMKGIADNFFDLAIVDPPYGIDRSGQVETFTKNKKHKRKHFEDKQWDSVAPNESYFIELFRVSKNQIIWGANYFTKHLPASMGWIVWDKGQSLSMSDGELAYTSFNKALRIIEMNRVELLKEGTIHPTQKPVKLYKQLLAFSKIGRGKIFDSHMGSQSSRIACYDMGFDFYGCELNKDYFEKGNKRFELFKQQLKLIAP